MEHIKEMEAGIDKLYAVESALLVRYNEIERTQRVSREDISQINQLVSMESFHGHSLNGFTAESSKTQLNVALEGIVSHILKTIGNTIKAIFKLIATIFKGIVDFIKRLFTGFKTRVTKDAVMAECYKAITKIETMDRRVVVDRKADQYVQEYQNKLKYYTDNYNALWHDYLNDKQYLRFLTKTNAVVSLLPREAETRLRSLLDLLTTISKHTPANLTPEWQSAVAKTFGGAEWLKPHEQLNEVNNEYRLIKDTSRINSLIDWCAELRKYIDNYSQGDQFKVNRVEKPDEALKAIFDEKSPHGKMASIFRASFAEEINTVTTANSYLDTIAKQFDNVLPSLTTELANAVRSYITMLRTSITGYLDYVTKVLMPYVNRTDDLLEALARIAIAQINRDGYYVTVNDPGKTAQVEEIKRDIKKLLITLRNF